MMKIIGSLTSPFTRIVRTVCEELSIPYECEVTAFFKKLTKEQDDVIASHNPLMRVPILIDGETEILDSRMIVQYLLKHKNGATDFRIAFPANIQEDNILTVIYGVIDPGILRFVLAATHSEIKADEGYMARSLVRIGRGLAWLDKQPGFGQSFGVPEAMLVCGLEWFTKRNVYDWSGFPHLVKIHAAYKDRPSLVKTRIPENV